MPFPYLGEKKTLDDASRAQLGRDFIQLSDGFTHYEIGGPEQGPPVVLVHGFSVPSFIWKPTYLALTEAGFRVLRYDLFGRGYSDRPEKKYNLELFTRQLNEIIKSTALQSPASLIGLSMGGLVAVNFTNCYRRKVDNLVLIAPAGFPLTQRLPFWLLRIPVLGELLAWLLGNGRMLKAIANDVYDPKLVDQFTDSFRPQMEYKGFKRALLSTMRDGMLGDYSKLYQRVGQKSPVALLIWGRQDQTIPFAHSQYILDAIPRINFLPVENAGHIPHYEQRELVNKRIIGFLST